MKKQVEAGLRPAPESIRGGFWAPYDEDRYWQRQTQTWTLPALFHVYGNAWTMKELYGIWCEMALMIQRSRRGQGETAKEHQANLQKTKDEVQQFLDANNLGRPQSPAEWRQCYRELWLQSTFWSSRTMLESSLFRDLVLNSSLLLSDIVPLPSGLPLQFMPSFLWFFFLVFGMA